MKKIKILKRFLSVRSGWMILGLGILVAVALSSCRGGKTAAEPMPADAISSGADSTGALLEIYFTRGKSHNHPLMVFWLEDEAGNYLKTLYVARSIGKGVFSYGATDRGAWMPGPIQRPAALPYWGYKRNVKNEFGNYIPSPGMPLPDAITGPTPPRDFILKTYTGTDVPDQVVLKMEINQTWDFNEFWTNGKYPGNTEYTTSCQPALVYEARISLKDTGKEITMKPIGHSHYDGSDGSLTPDLTTLTTALDIAKELKVVVR
ncbi:MAG TPA: hypothetical protein P5228_07550 [Bacteroidales bacterium]|nr:hypothetical protein [Bacteroidales bacterium]HRZ50196.1 hypothetical protein [Bacteroidales bacterium]